MGADGLRLLSKLDDPEAPPSLERAASGGRGLLRKRSGSNGTSRPKEGWSGCSTRKRCPKPPRSSAHETEARHSTKGGTSRLGYTRHTSRRLATRIYEPNPTTNVRTTVAAATDVKQLRGIQEGLARSGLLPAARATGGRLLRSWEQPRLEPRPPQDRPHRPGLQGRHPAGQSRRRRLRDVANSRAEWDDETLSPPEGRKSVGRSETKSARGRQMIHVDFSPRTIAPRVSEPCPSCTRAKNLPRALTLRPKEGHEAIRFARKRQKTEDFPPLYSRRAGMEGTVSQGARAFGLRQAR